MADNPQQPAADEPQLVPVRYIGAEDRIINGEATTYGDIVYLPQSEVDSWPSDGPHPYYERADGETSPSGEQATQRSPVSEQAVAVQSQEA
jgi:hypothetical protein